ncbi:MAG: hypothetical protein KDJ72_03500, partial [Methyloceanibacter sp.]|uniref:hypothetical protein n=1 Tax=Methyloceanibacter sp. TaxID=1965321 RepID=UPI001DEBEF05
MPLQKSSRTHTEVDARVHINKDTPDRVGEFLRIGGNWKRAKRLSELLHLLTVWIEVDRRLPARQR